MTMMATTRRTTTDAGIDDDDDHHHSQQKQDQQQRQQQEGREDSSSITTTTTTTTTSTGSPILLRFIDVGANLLDDRFMLGTYRGIQRHEPDIHNVIQRAERSGVSKIILTAGTVDESKHAVKMARLWNQKRTSTSKQSDEQDDASTSNTSTNIQFHCTVGVHPTRCRQVFEEEEDEEQASDADADANADKKEPAATDEVDSDENLVVSDHANRLLDELLDIAIDGMIDGTVIAIGEIGLDYDRLEFCPKHIQLKYLRLQLERIAKQTKLPLFLHNRSVGQDLYDILTKHKDCWKHNSNDEDHGVGGGVVHSFDDTYELASMFMNDLGLYIGLNGCSLRTDDNINVVKQLPLQKILLETDCPYCDVRKTHSGYQYIQTKYDDQTKTEKKFQTGYMIKNRQEPIHVRQIAEIIAGCKELSLRHVANVCYDNTIRLFGLSSK